MLITLTVTDTKPMKRDSDSHGSEDIDRIPEVKFGSKTRWAMNVRLLNWELAAEQLGRNYPRIQKDTAYY